MSEQEQESEQEQSPEVCITINTFINWFSKV